MMRPRSQIPVKEGLRPKIKGYGYLWWCPRSQIPVKEGLRQPVVVIVRHVATTPEAKFQ